MDHAFTPSIVLYGFRVNFLANHRTFHCFRLSYKTCVEFFSGQVKLFQGKKLDFEPKCCEEKRSERDFMTAVEFSAENPYGKAVALLDLKSGSVKVHYCFSH